MRWFKHLSHASEGRFLSRLLLLFGPEGYGVWWLILEEIAAGMDGSERCTTTKTVKAWAVSCHVSTQKLKKLLEYCEENGKLRADFSGGLLSISCPNLLKYRDETTRKLRKASGSDAGTGSGAIPHRIEKNREEKRREEETSGSAAGGPGAPGAPGSEEHQAGKAILERALVELGIRQNPAPAAEYLNRQDPQDLALIARAAGLGIEVHDRTPRATILTLIEARARKAERITPRGEKY